jgi:PIN domain.
VKELKYLLDTDILFSKRYLQFKGEGVVTVITLYEFITIIRRRHIDTLKNGNKSRAEGYIKFLNLVIADIKDSILEINKNDILDAVNLVFDRNIDVGDAINTIVARRINSKIVSKDKDYERVKDLVEVILP